MCGCEYVCVAGVGGDAVIDQLLIDLWDKANTITQNTLHAHSNPFDPVLSEHFNSDEKQNEQQQTKQYDD